jgi:two-component system, NtrC family, response regulator AlgB
MLSAELMSSTLFGHKKGSFPGAVSDGVGKVETAEGGTLFLDEVADLGADAQARLLRFLHDRHYERLGDPTERRADVRLITATNRPLEEEVKAGRFREDLLFRLNVIALTVPSLRDRYEDILPLAMHYLRFFGRQQARQRLEFSDSCKRAILDYSWPGNLRELRNAVERAVILSPVDILEPQDLGLSPGAGDGQGSAAFNAHPGSGHSGNAMLGENYSLEEIEREHIARVVARAPTFEAAAQTLAIDPTTLQRKRKRYGLA